LENLDVDSMQIEAVMDLLVTGNFDFKGLLYLDNIMIYAVLDPEKAAKILVLTKVKLLGIISSMKQYL
jgi:hypothetical protein